MKGNTIRTVCRYCGAEIDAGSAGCPVCRGAFIETCSICKTKLDKGDGISYQKLFFCRHCLINDKEKAIRKTSYELRRNVFYARFIVNMLRRRMLLREERRLSDG